jgi:hypothetical protein
MILNEIKIVMGGEDRTLRFSMISTKKFIADAKDPSFQAILNSSVDLVMYLIDLGLRNKPEGYSKDLLEEWVDDMDFSEYEKAKDFSLQAMGFMIQQEQAAGDILKGVVPQGEIPTR